jgi:site-specific recombinase XerC
MAWKTLARMGKHGETVRVVEETGSARGKRVLVIWRELLHPGAKKKSRKILTYDATPEGRAEARAAADGVHQGLQVRRRDGPTAPPLAMTLHALFARFAEARFPLIRQVTRDNYRGAWRKWEVMWATEFPADNATLAMLDEFVAQEIRLKRSVNVTRILVQIIRGIHRWGLSRELLTRNRLEGFRWQAPKDAKRYEPGEYRSTEFEALLAQLDPTFGRDWRAHSVLMLVGHQGVRIRTALHLRWEHLDLTRARILWPAQYIKKGQDFEQPLTFGGYAAVLTARYQAARVGYTGPWVFFGNRRARWNTAADGPLTYGAVWLRLRQAEKDAGIPHEAFRAFHGMRRGVVGNVYDDTGDIRAALEMIGDSDLKQAKSYLKKRDSRIVKAADSIDAMTPKGSPEASPARMKGRAHHKRARKGLALNEMQTWMKANDGTRTHDPRITNAVLYRLSYAGTCAKGAHQERPVLHALARIRTATPCGTTPSR